MRKRIIRHQKHDQPTLHIDCSYYIAEPEDYETSKKMYWFEMKTTMRAALPHEYVCIQTQELWSMIMSSGAALLSWLASP